MNTDEVSDHHAQTSSLHNSQDLGLTWAGGGSICRVESTLYQKFAMIFVGSLVSSACLAGDWKQSSFAFVSARWKTVVHQVGNTGPSAITVMGVTGNDVQYQRVIGAADQNPPTWHAKFTPLSSTQVTYPWEIVQYVLPSMHVGRGLVLWDRELGWQEFEWHENDLGTGLKLRRDREWHENPGFVFGIFPITEED